MAVSGNKINREKKRRHESNRQDSHSLKCSMVMANYISLFISSSSQWDTTNTETTLREGESFPFFPYLDPLSSLIRKCRIAFTHSPWFLAISNFRPFSSSFTLVGLCLPPLHQSITLFLQDQDLSFQKVFSNLLFPTLITPHFCLSSLHTVLENLPPQTDCKLFRAKILLLLLLSLQGTVKLMH